MIFFSENFNELIPFENSLKEILSKIHFKAKSEYPQCVIRFVGEKNNIDIVVFSAIREQDTCYILNTHHKIFENMTLSNIHLFEGTFKSKSVEFYRTDNLKIGAVLKELGYSDEYIKELSILHYKNQMSFRHSIKNIKINLFNNSKDIFGYTSEKNSEVQDGQNRDRGNSRKIHTQQNSLLREQYRERGNQTNIFRNFEENLPQVINRSFSFKNFLKQRGNGNTLFRSNSNIFGYANAMLEQRNFRGNDFRTGNYIEKENQKFGTRETSNFNESGRIGKESRDNRELSRNSRYGDSNNGANPNAIRGSLSQKKDNKRRNLFESLGNISEPLSESRNTTITNTSTNEQRIEVQGNDSQRLSKDISQNNEKTRESNNRTDSEESYQEQGGLIEKFLTISQREGESIPLFGENGTEYRGEESVEYFQSIQNISLGERDTKNLQPIDVFKTFKKVDFQRVLAEKGYEGGFLEAENFNDKERIQANIEAIKLTQKIFAENRILATAEEQTVLAKYTGFGGLRKLFYNEFRDEDKKDSFFEKANEELKSLLGIHYTDILESSANSYYTPSLVIKAMYQNLKNIVINFEIEKEKIRALEPCCGIGKFMALAPKNIIFEAIEKDIISATIAKLLNPHVVIYNMAFENFQGESQYNLIIGNPPYDNLKIKDYSSVANNLLIHNYFVIKSQDFLIKEGVSSFLITSNFADAREDSIHKGILKDTMIFLGGMRLPNSIFEKINADLMTDMLFFQKKNNIEESNALTDALIQTEIFGLDMEEESVEYSSYFRNNKIGEYNLRKNQYGEIDLFLFAQNIREEDLHLQNYMHDIHRVHVKPCIIENKETNTDGFLEYEDFANTEKEKYINDLKIGNIFEYNNRIYTIQEDLMGNKYYPEVFFVDKVSKAKLQSNNIEIIEDDENDNSQTLIQIRLNEEEVYIAKQVIMFRDKLKMLIDLERTEIPDGDLMKLRIELQELREKILKNSLAIAFNANQRNVIDKETGYIIRHSLKKIIELDTIESYKIYATEQVINSTKKVTKRDGSIEYKNKIEYKLSDILTKRVIKPKFKKIAETAEEALIISFNKKGKIDIEEIASALPTVNIEEILKTLADKKFIYPSFEDKEYILNFQFLSGNVKEKYNHLLAMLQKEESFDLPYVPPLEVMMEDLKNVFPEDVSFSDISITFGANYIPLEYYEDFLKETFFLNPYEAELKIRIIHGKYFLTELVGELRNFTDEFLVKNENNDVFFEFSDIFIKTINNESLEVYHYIEKNDERVKVVELYPTQQAQQASERMLEEFQLFLVKDTERRDTITKIYNETINVINTKTAPNTLLTPHLNVELRPHQINVLSKAITQNSLLLDHQVGTGKTLCAIAMVMEQRRMGLINKSLIIVPNHLTKQWALEFYKAYPQADILVDNIERRKKREKRILI